MSTADDEVLAAAEELGKALRDAQQEQQSRFQFDSLLMRCNDAIGQEIGIDYGSACGAGGGSC